MARITIDTTWGILRPARDGDWNYWVRVAKFMKDNSLDDTDTANVIAACDAVDAEDNAALVEAANLENQANSLLARAARLRRSAKVRALE